MGAVYEIFVLFFWLTRVCFIFTFGLTVKLSVWTIERQIKRKGTNAVGNEQEIQLDGNVAVAKCCRFSIKSNDLLQVVRHM